MITTEAVTYLQYVLTLFCCQVGKGTMIDDLLGRHRRILPRRLANKERHT